MFMTLSNATNFETLYRAQFLRCSLFPLLRITKTNFSVKFITLNLF